MTRTVVQSERLNQFFITDATGAYGVAEGAILVDPGTGLPYSAQQSYVWDTVGLAWIKATPAGAGGGGAATIADGADVAQGTTSDAAWVSGSGTVIALLKKIASGGGSAVSIADGSDVTQGALADAAVVTDVAGSLSAKLRGLVKIFASVWDAANGRLKVDGSAVTQPISATALPLPTGASTSALQTTVNTSAGSIDTKTPALGQALAAASVPVVLTAVQVSALTPPVAITGFALEAGHLATIDTNAAKIPAQGQALAAASMPVVLTAIQQTALTPPAAITGFALDATVATLLKPASTLAGVTTVTAVTAITNALPAGTNKIGTIDIATAPAVAKGTQGANGVPIQNLKDSGRNQSNLYTATDIALTAADALISLTGYKSLAAVGATTTPAVVTAAKIFRAQSLVISYIATSTTLGSVQLTLRANTGGVVAIGSPAVCSWKIGVELSAEVVGVVETVEIPLPDGMEFAAGTGIGLSAIGYVGTVATAVGAVRATLIGYEY